MRLTASTSVQSVRERLGVGDAETLRESEKRRQYLQTYARLLAPVRPSVRFSETIHTATTNYRGDTPELTITTRAFDQPATDFRRRVFDLAVQEALTVHEVGHLRYTDSDGFRALLARVDPERRRLFSRVWNTLEDGAIERQLRHRYAVAPELEVLNANLFRAGTFGHEPADTGVQRLSLFHAVICGLADMAIYDSGRFRRLQADDTGLKMVSLRDRRVLQTFVPTMRETVAAVLSEPDPAARNEQIWSFWQALVDTLDASAASGAGASELARLIDEDGTVRARETAPSTPRQTTDAAILVEDGAGAPLPGKPDDTAGEFSVGTRQARDLARDAVADEIDRQLESVLGSEDEETASATTKQGEADETGDGTTLPHRTQDGATADALLDAQSHPGAGDLTERQRDEGTDADGASGAGSGGGGAPTAPGEADGADSVATGGDTLEAALRRRYNEELATEASELDKAEARLDSFEAYVHALEAADVGDASLQVVTDEPGDDSPERWAGVRRDAKRLAKRFRSRLQEQRRDVTRSRRRRGSLDRSRLVAASRGRPDVFTQTEDGTDRRYTCAIVLDRSGSMGDGAVTAAERGALTVAVALETVGVDVALLDLHDSTVRLVKTTAETVRETRGRALTAQAGGGTPLAQALALTRARFGDAENAFTLVVTDGLPDDVAAYTAELDASTMPVLGVYLRGPNGSEARPIETDRSYFHQLAVVEDADALDQRLQALAGRVLF